MNSLNESKYRKPLTLGVEKLLRTRYRKVLKKVTQLCVQKSIEKKLPQRATSPPITVLQLRLHTEWAHISMQLMTVAIILFRLFLSMVAQNCSQQYEKSYGQMYICTQLHHSQIETYLTPTIPQVGQTQAMPWTSNNRVLF